MNVLERDQTCRQLCHSNIFSFAQLLFHFWHISLAKHFKCGKNYFKVSWDKDIFCSVETRCLYRNDPKRVSGFPTFKGKMETLNFQRAKPPRVQNVDKDD